MEDLDKSAQKEQPVSVKKQKDTQPMAKEQSLLRLTSHLLITLQQTFPLMF